MFLGFDDNGKNKIGERLMNSFIEGKGNLDFFARGVDGIASEISLGMKDYGQEKKDNACFLDGEC